MKPRRLQSDTIWSMDSAAITGKREWAQLRVGWACQVYHPTRAGSNRGCTGERKALLWPPTKEVGMREELSAGAVLDRLIHELLGGDRGPHDLIPAYSS